uniref:rRNA biogenesis protein RRP5 n=1 Tax=Lutzomyia longipalpis TaxID=7200 RepID=A0A1B0GJY3_LUTLO
MVFVEKTFPRGGEIKRKKVNAGDGSKQQFGAISKKTFVKKKHKKSDKKKNESGVAKEESLESRKAELISSRTIAEGMLLMGYIKSILQTDLYVSLPGRLQGRVSINSISSPYTNALENVVQGEGECKTLVELFDIGQEVYVKVMEISKGKTKGDTKRIELSLNPKDLHSDVHHAKLQKGLIMSGAIESVEDHGYIVDLGIANVRAFLPTKGTSHGKYSVGELIMCTLHKVTTNSSVTTVQLKECTKEKVLSSEEDIQLDHVFPTLTVKFIIVDCVKNGLMGKILDGTYTAYINQTHLGQGKRVEDFEIGSEIEAKVLYVMPLTKFVYLTLNSFVTLEHRIPYGVIMKNVEILGKSQSGILLKLSDSAKGLITYSHMRVGIHTNVDEDELSKKYTQPKLSILRVMDYNPVDDVYICTDKQSLINEKYFCLEDAKIGDFVQVKITKKVPSKGFAVSFGQLQGFIYQAHLSKMVSKQNVGSKVRGRVLFIDEQYKKVVFTTRPEYLKENAAIICERGDILPGKSYIGMIHDVTTKKILVQFFNRILGAVIKGSDLVNRSYYESMKAGQIVKVTVTSANDRFINLTFDRGTNEDSVKYGKVFNSKIVGSYTSGIEVEAENSKSNTWISNHYVTETPQLAQILSSCLDSGEVRVVKLSDDIYSLRDVSHFCKFKMSSWKSLSPGMILRGFVKCINHDCLEVHLPLRDATKTTKIFYPMILKNYQEGDEEGIFHPEQIIHVKVLSKDMKTGIISCSALLSQVWNGNVKASVKILTNFFKDLDTIYAKLSPKYKTGDKVSAKVEEIREESVSVKIGGTKQMGIIPRHLLDGEPTVGEKLQCIVLWVSPEGLIHLSNKSSHMEMRGNKDHPPFSHIKQAGEIILKTDHFFLVLLESNHVVYVPLKLHYNDFCPVLADRKGQCEVILLNDRAERVIAIFKDIYEECRNINEITEGRKRKQESISESEKDELPSKRIKAEEKMEVSDKEDDDDDAVDENRETAPTAGSSNFWNTDFSWLPSAVKSESEDDSEGSDAETPAKKKKLTASERLEHAKSEEARIREREENLADGISDPQNTDDFERLVLTTPNNSLIWIKYMVYYLQATEVEKARGVARRAIKSISYREEVELTNMWVALLNLELRFGTRDSFEGVLSEAMEVNDQFRIMMKTIEMLADVRKIEELRAKVAVAVKKFRDNPEMWTKVGAAYFTVGLINDAKQLMHRAIGALPQRDHIAVISSFAKLHNKFDEKETAHALLEQIVTSYPKRVDIWSMYVDMLTKDSRHDLARQILDRAILQKLPLKKMRSLFKKYQDFEEKFGNEQSVEKIKSMAEEFVQNYIKT